MAGVLLLSPLCSAVGTLLIKRDGAGTSSVILNRDGITIAAGTILVAALILEHDQEVRWTGMAVFSVCYMGLCATVLAFTLYFWLLRTVRANQLALISYVTPLIALLLGFVFRNEAVSLQTLCGAALILGGVIASRR
jgi:drug/metabolite transporter (DMT)-like permease